MSRISLLVLCIALVCASAAAEWVNVPGGPGTACAHGTPYSYFYKPGTTNKLAIFFEGPYIDPFFIFLFFFPRSLFSFT